MTAFAAAAGVLGHAFQPGGRANVPLIVGGGAVLGVAIILRILGKHSLAIILLAAGAGLALSGLFVDPGPPSSSATVSVVRPAEGAEVDAGKPLPIVVRLEGGEIATSPADTSGGHLHLYVDGKLQQMPYSTRTEVTLPAGPHELRVEYVDNRHLSFTPEVSWTVYVTAN
jgi:hypothetical protein